MYPMRKRKRISRMFTPVVLSTYLSSSNCFKSPKISFILPMHVFRRLVTYLIGSLRGRLASFLSSYWTFWMKSCVKRLGALLRCNDFARS